VWSSGGYHLYGDLTPEQSGDWKDSTPSTTDKESTHVTADDVLQKSSLSNHQRVSSNADKDTADGKIGPDPAPA
jgi:hypothetical protein